MAEAQPTMPALVWGAKGYTIEQLHHRKKTGDGPQFSWTFTDDEASAFEQWKTARGSEQAPPRPSELAQLVMSVVPRIAELNERRDLGELVQRLLRKLGVVARNSDEESDLIDGAVREVLLATENAQPIETSAQSLVPPQISTGTAHLNAPPSSGDASGDPHRILSSRTAVDTREPDLGSSEIKGSAAYPLLPPALTASASIKSEPTFTERPSPRSSGRDFTPINFIKRDALAPQRRFTSSNHHPPPDDYLNPYSTYTPDHHPPPPPTSAMPGSQPARTGSAMHGPQTMRPGPMGPAPPRFDSTPAARSPAPQVDPRDKRANPTTNPSDQRGASSRSTPSASRPSSIPRPDISRDLTDAREQIKLAKLRMAQGVREQKALKAEYQELNLRREQLVAQMEELRLGTFREV